MRTFRDLPLFMTASEIADLLRTTPKAVYTMNDRGQIPGATRLGKRLLFRRDYLLEWLDDESRASSLEE